MTKVWASIQKDDQFSFRLKINQKAEVPPADGSGKGADGKSTGPDASQDVCQQLKN